VTLKASVPRRGGSGLRRRGLFDEEPGTHRRRALAGGSGPRSLSTIRLTCIGRERVVVVYVVAGPAIADSE